MPVRPKRLSWGLENVSDRGEARQFSHSFALMNAVSTMESDVILIGASTSGLQAPGKVDFGFQGETTRDHQNPTRLC